MADTGTSDVDMSEDVELSDNEDNSVMVAKANNTRSSPRCVAGIYLDCPQITRLLTNYKIVFRKRKRPSEDSYDDTAVATRRMATRSSITASENESSVTPEPSEREQVISALKSILATSCSLTQRLETEPKFEVDHNEPLPTLEMIDLSMKLFDGQSHHAIRAEHYPHFFERQLSLSTGNTAAGTPSSE